MIDMIAAKRRSIRRFTGESIDETTIRELLVTAGRAPSGKNRQPWYFTVVTDKAKRELASILWQTAIDKESRGEVFGSLRISARAMEEAGAVILVGNRYAPLEQDYNDKRYRRVMDTQSIGAAIQTMLLAATEKGLGLCGFVTYFNVKRRFKPGGDAKMNWWLPLLLVCRRKHRIHGGVKMLIH